MREVTCFTNSIELIKIEGSNRGELVVFVGKSKQFGDFLIDSNLFPKIIRLFNK